MRFEEFYDIIVQDRAILDSEIDFYHRRIRTLYDGLNKPFLTEKEVQNYSKAFGTGILVGLESARNTLSSLEDGDC